MLSLLIHIAGPEYAQNMQHCAFCEDFLTLHTMFNYINSFLKIKSGKFLSPRFGPGALPRHPRGPTISEKSKSSNLTEISPIDRARKSGQFSYIKHVLELNRSKDISIYVWSRDLNFEN